MPGWLQAISKVNPLSYEVNALRGLLIGLPTNLRWTSRYWPAPPRPGSPWPLSCSLAWRSSGPAMGAGWLRCQRSFWACATAMTPRMMEMTPMIIGP